MPSVLKTHFRVEEAGNCFLPVPCWNEKLGHCIQNANRVFPGSGTPADTSCAQYNADREQQFSATLSQTLTDAVGTS